MNVEIRWHTRFKNRTFQIRPIKSFCFDVAMCDLVHDVRAIHGLSIWNSLWNDLNISFTLTVRSCYSGITHISEKISRCCSQLRKVIQTLNRALCH